MPFLIEYLQDGIPVKSGEFEGSREDAPLAAFLGLKLIPNATIARVLDDEGKLVVTVSQ
jgi:hypothetical protein